MHQMDMQKKLAAEKSVDFIKDDMIIGLGSGSTVNWMIHKLGEKVKAGLRVEGIPSSKKTERLANEVGIPLTDFSRVERIDIAIDGADEVDSDLNLLKGGGGSLVREKIVDGYAKELIIIVDESKLVEQLGTFMLPVEVLPFGWEVTARRIAAIGGTPTIRTRGGERFLSDNGNYILDCDFGLIKNPEELHTRLKQLTGVVETGIFPNMTSKLIVAQANGVKVIEK
ncbi:ribose-5-phosphate isomerase RpiA [Oceanobacillus sp. CAU 1775]